MLKTIVVTSLILIVSISYLMLTSNGEVVLNGNNVIPFELHDNRIFVKARIKGKECRLILDTGGNSHTILDESFARSLGLPLGKGRLVYGAGENPVSSYSSHVDSILVDNLLLTDQSITVISFSEMKTALHMDYLDGMVSSELFRQFTVEVNYEGNQIVLHDPALFQPRELAEKVPFDLLYQTPLIDGVVDGVKGKLIVDSGDRSNFTIFKNSSQTNKFLNNYSLSDTLMTGYGIGGPIWGRYLTLSEISIARNLKITNIQARIPTINGGAFDRNDNVLGSIGNGILLRFKSVTFDFRNMIMYIAE